MNLSNEKALLREIKLELSYKCNLSCIHCSSEGSITQNECISELDAVGIIDSAANLGTTTLSISGGEPFLWDGITQLINYSYKSIKNINIYTSGTTDNFEKVVNNISGEKIKFIFSIHGSTAKSHDLITQNQGSFEKTVSAINFTKNKKFPVELHFVPMAINLHELEPVAELAIKLKIDQLSVLRLVPQGRSANNKDLLLDINGNKKLRSSILKIRANGIKLRTGAPLNFLLLDNQPLCTSGYNKLIIAPDMNIYPCDAFKQLSSKKLFRDDKFSSLKNNNLQTCWKKSSYLNTIRQLLQIDCVEPCLSCSSFDRCRSGCLAQKILHSNSLAPTHDPSCILLKAI